MPPLKNVQELQEVPFLSQNNDRVNESQTWAFACVKQTVKACQHTLWHMYLPNRGLTNLFKSA